MGMSESMVRHALANPQEHDWTIQGFGMLRTWLDPEGYSRLHIWDTEKAYDQVPSTVHTHPWDFTSRIYFGRIINTRYVPQPDGSEYKWAKILTGRGGGLISEHETTRLTANPPEEYYPGSNYMQFAEEIHESTPDKGTVTVINRNFRYEREAAVYWPANAEWITAEPRVATMDEVMHFLSLVKT